MLTKARRVPTVISSIQTREGKGLAKVVEYIIFLDLRSKKNNVINNRLSLENLHTNTANVFLVSDKLLSDLL